ncbi:hypothetical protein H1Q63_15565 [Desmonostoc muscorum CCALA 125]|nr:hypothetical protein [Desmonostoc muscorum CCALA 125]
MGIGHWALGMRRGQGEQGGHGSNFSPLSPLSPPSPSSPSSPSSPHSPLPTPYSPFFNVTICLPLSEPIYHFM